MRTFFGCVLVVLAIGAIAASIVSLFADVKPPSTALLYALVAMVFSRAAGDYLGDGPL